MSIAVIGSGNTGSAVIELLNDRCGTVFNSRHLPSVKQLQQHQGAIVFVAPQAAEGVLQLLTEAAIPVAWGTTGYDLCISQLSPQLTAPWVVAANFSLSMVAIEQAIDQLGRWAQVAQPQAQCHEVHHLHKQDQPSGTAKAWSQWLNFPCSISSDRESDINGVHTLCLETTCERITLEHHAHSRKLFAHGAIWALDQMISRALKPQCYSLAEIWQLAT